MVAACIISNRKMQCGSNSYYISENPCINDTFIYVYKVSNNIVLYSSFPCYIISDHVITQCVTYGLMGYKGNSSSAMLIV